MANGDDSGLSDHNEPDMGADQPIHPRWCQLEPLLEPEGESKHLDAPNEPLCMPSLVLVQDPVIPP